MGLLDKFKGMINPDSIDDNYDEEEYVFDGDDGNGGNNKYAGYEGNYTQGQPQQGQQGAMSGYTQQNRQQQYGAQGQTQQGQQGMTIDSNSLELKVVRPERFDAVLQIADHLLNGRTVVLNLEATNRENARRMIDFLTGVAYSISGDLRKVSNQTYVITPNNVDVSAEQQGGGAQQQGQRSGQGKNINLNTSDMFGEM